MRIFLIILGALLSLGGVACGASGIAAYRSVDSDGFVSGGGHMSTATAAFVTETAEFEAVDTDAASKGGKTRLRIRAERADGKPIFIGIASDDAVGAFLADGSFETVRDLKFGPFDYDHVSQGGTRALSPPTPAAFTASAAGPGEQELVWTIAPGKWRAVIMNADGSPGVDVQTTFGVRFPYLRGFAIAAMVIGVTLLLVGVLLLVFQLRPRRRLPAEAAEPAP